MRRKRLLYLCAFTVLFAAEILIGVFCHDRFVRPYLGDVLVIPLLCCLLRVALPERPRLLGIYMILAGIAAELLQLARLGQRLGLEGTLPGIILGACFDWADIGCYIIGGLLFLLIEDVLRRRATRGRK